MRPFQIVCDCCGSRLRAGGIAHLWLLFHFLFFIGIAWVVPAFFGYPESWSVRAMIVLSAAILVFFTAFVIPYFWLGGVYRLDDGDE